ncbi:uncharacterized protein [Palaemon carinicauda]|uniref:uncharacterized protein n=1 Tax=Palaemon carinicauda TaxID=392227 RepID=UPI0035B6A349
MGHRSTGDAYTRLFDNVIQDIYDDSIEGTFWHAYDSFETCAAKGITLKPEKFQFARREVDFVGFNLAWEAYKPTEEGLAAIKNFPMPRQPSITDVRAWYRFVNQLAPFLATAPIMIPFRELLKKRTGKLVYWNEALRTKFHHT